MRYSRLTWTVKLSLRKGHSRLTHDTGRDTSTVGAEQLYMLDTVGR